MTGFGRIDMTDAVAWRTALLAASPEAEPRITYTDVFVKACACLLREFPELNSYIDGDDVVTWNDVHVGMAVSVDGGLIVPVIRHADRLALADIAAYRQALIERARNGRLAPADVSGGTFTVSNFGSYGGDFETAILNTPQSALLGIGRISEEPAVRNGQIVIRQMMMISLTFDHRLIDGALAGRFRARLRGLMEQPALMGAWLQSNDARDARS
jgi:pyruvate/2-oxoglutarate dehydrogenase complex dihydrolipoamide acyltransferase (E2) component